jgi:hypothetical protein
VAKKQATKPAPKSELAPVDPVAKVKELIDRINGDTSVPASKTHSDLVEIRDHANSWIEALEETNDFAGELEDEPDEDFDDDEDN